jgi:hypothetical protein
MSKKQVNNLIFVVQGKGGVGKSLLSFYLTQYFQKAYNNVYAFDVDAEQNTLANKLVGTNINVETVDIVDPESEDIDKSKFLNLADHLIVKAEKNVIVDVGTSISKSFVVFLKTLNVLDILKKYFNIKIFTIVTADAETHDYVNNLYSLNTEIIMFKNEYFGKFNFATDYVFFKPNDFIKKAVEFAIKNGITYDKINSTNSLQILEKVGVKQAFEHYFSQFEKIFQKGD